MQRNRPEVDTVEIEISFFEIYLVRAYVSVFLHVSIGSGTEVESPSAARHCGVGCRRKRFTICCSQMTNMAHATTASSRSECGGCSGCIEIEQFGSVAVHAEISSLVVKTGI